jgi:signal transduction histidine kinase
VKRNHRRWWLVYGACVALTLAALSWMTLSVLELERAEQQARRNTAHETAVRLALWRMDSWFAPHLEQEAARPYYEYLPYYSEERAYTRLFNRIEPGEVLSPSPLLDFRSDIIRIHFQVDADGAWSSPQVPTGNLRDLSESTGHEAAELDRMQERLRELASMLGREELACAQVESEDALVALLGKATARKDLAGKFESALQERERAASPAANERDLSIRAQQSYQLQKKNLDAGAVAPPAGDAWSSSVSTGPLVPVWFAGAPGRPADELCFVRRVRVGSKELFQGFVADWPRLRTALLAQVEDLLPAAELVPHGGSDTPPDDASQRIAAFPAVLHARCPPSPPLDLVTPVRATLWATWLAAFAAVAAVGYTLHASIAHGEKRSRFASAVTHELRTPLTTFRMYSEMLAKGMVPESQRALYLETLEKESDRLAHLVENVLTHAQLEEGRRKLSRERVSLAAVLERALPMLERRAREAGMQLALDLDGCGRRELETDADAIGQILLNLVDNACKYGRPSAPATIELSARADERSLTLCVRDRGPGVPAALARAIFEPFERGERDERDPNPGIGLGLAIALGLARELGGDLRLEPVEGPGACFGLELALLA